MKKLCLILVLLSTVPLDADDGWWNFFFGGQKEKNLGRGKHQDYYEWFCEKYPNASPEEKKEALRIVGIERAGQYENGKKLYEIEKFKVIFNAITTPRGLLSITAASLGVFGAYQGTLFMKDIVENYIKLPTLTKETSIRTFSSRVKDLFMYEDRKAAPRNNVVLNELLQMRVEMVTESIVNAKANNTCFRHILFYGPPGTGKTMLAKAIAQEVGLDWIYISGGTLDKYELEDGMRKIEHLFEYSKAFPKKLMIIIDEAEKLFGSRSKDDSLGKRTSYLAEILRYTGTEQSNFVVVAITNRPQDFDSASLSRFGENIFIGAPGFEERKKIFAEYIEKYLINSHKEKQDNRTLIQMLYTSKPKDRIPLLLADDVFSDGTLCDDLLSELSRRSDGFVGRDISDVIITVQNASYGRADKLVTAEILEAALEYKKQQNRIMKTKFEDDWVQRISAAV